MVGGLGTFSRQSAAEGKMAECGEHVIPAQRDLAKMQQDNEVSR